MNFYAHKREGTDGETVRQTVYTHLNGTAQRAAQCLRAVGLEKAGYLAGLLHDMGKYTEVFQQYLETGDQEKRGSVIHTFQGCRYIMETFHGADAECAELIAFAVGAHYSSVSDCDRRLCMVSGTEDLIVSKYQRGIISKPYTAKLISCNDNEGFTYRGRFLEGWQAATVGYIASQKAHNRQFRHTVGFFSCFRCAEYCP